LKFVRFNLSEARKSFFNRNSHKELSMHILKPFFALSNNLFFLLLGIFGIGFIIGFHELGHFLFGKLFHIKTPSFSIGFGPKIYKRKIGETQFSISAIPLGGYVESDRESFESKPYYQKMLVIGGGIGFNLLFAYIVFCILFLTGIPKTRFLYPLNTSPVVQAVAKEQEIEKLGLKAGDRILSINDIQIGSNTKALFQHIKDAKTKTLKLTLSRGNDMLTLNLPTGELMKAFGTFKIRFQFIQKSGLPFFRAIREGIRLTNTFIANTLLIFKYIFVKRDVSGVGGPILIISETVKSASKGFKIFLLFLAIISISLAVINLIPLPILDGGQALLYTVEAITRKKLAEKTKEYIFIVSWIFMIFLFVLISARDIWRIVSPYFAKFLKK